MPGAVCLFEKFLDGILGSRKDFHELYIQAFGSGSWDAETRRFRFRTGLSYGIVLGCGTVMAFWSIWRRSYAGEEGVWFLVLFELVMGLLMTYMKRWDGAKKEIRRDKEQILRDYPDFVDRLLLLLNGGLVLSSALHRLAEDGAPLRAARKVPALYRELYRLHVRVTESNLSLVGEFQKFASCLGIRELMRFSAILSHSFQKGSSLKEKLEAERELLLEIRKGRAREWSHQAETRLVFPLMIQLLILILITIAPAMMAM